MARVSGSLSWRCSIRQTFAHNGSAASARDYSRRMRARCRSRTATPVDALLARQSRPRPVSDSLAHPGGLDVDGAQCCVVRVRRVAAVADAGEGGRSRDARRRDQDPQPQREIGHSLARTARRPNVVDLKREEVVVQSHIVDELEAAIGGQRHTVVEQECALETVHETSSALFEGYPALIGGGEGKDPPQLSVEVRRELEHEGTARAEARNVPRAPLPQDRPSSAGGVSSDATLPRRAIGGPLSPVDCAEAFFWRSGAQFRCACEWRVTA